MITWEDYEEDFELVSRRVRVVDEQGEVRYVDAPSPLRDGLSIAA